MKRYIYLTLVIIWMITVFMFSNQVANVSSKTSGNVSSKIVTAITKNKKLTQENKEKMSQSIEIPIRKLAHFSIYAIGGFLIFCFINTFNIPTKNKFVYSFLFGMFYAFTDEFHQYFVDGRSCEFRDVCIDSAGVVLGVIISILTNKFFIF